MKYLIAIVIALITVSTSTGQQVLDTSKVFGLDYLIDNAVNKNTKFEPIEYQRKIELIKKEQVNKQPMPMFEAMIDYIPLDLMSKPEYSGFLTQRIMLPGKLSTMELTSDVNAKKQNIVKEQLKIELIRQIKANYFNLYYYEKLLGFNSEYQSILKNIIKSLEVSYSSGMGTQNQILKMNNEIQMLEFEKTEMEAMREVYVNNLRVISNLNISDDFHTKDLQTIMSTQYDMDSLKLTEILIKNNPEFKMIDNMIEGSRIDKKIAEFDRIPDFTFTGGYRYMAKEPMSYLTFSIGIDLPFMPWNSKRINAIVDEKTAMELQAVSMRNSSLKYMKSELQGMLIMINSIRSKITYLKEVLIPQTEQTFNSTLVSYSSSTGEFMNLLDSYRKLRETSQMLAKEETELLKQYGELEFLLGRQITKIN
jgi:outer membrane protein, heavy metal efflux system